MLEQTRRVRPLGRAVGMVGGYLACFWSIRLVFLTVVAYTFISADSAAQSTLQKIGDVVRANQALTTGFSALFFVIMLQVLQPLTRTGIKQVFNFAELKRAFAPNALNGLILVTVLIIGTMLGGHMNYLGIYMRFDEVVLTLASAGIFSAALFVMVIVEEFVFREVLEPKLSEYFGAISIMAISSVFYLAVKFVQFDLGWIEAGNLVLLNLTFSIIAHAERSYMASASFAGAFLVASHIGFGLPLLGQDMPGILLLRASSDDGLGSLLSGGNAGPEGGLILTVLLVIYLYLPQIRSKKIEV